MKIELDKIRDIVKSVESEDHEGICFLIFKELDKLDKENEALKPGDLVIFTPPKMFKHTYKLPKITEDGKVYYELVYILSEHETAPLIKYCKLIKTEEWNVS